MSIVERFRGFAELDPRLNAIESLVSQLSEVLTVTEHEELIRRIYIQLDSLQS
jgi:hypothetical protein